MNSKGTSIWTPWRQALPDGIKAAAADARPMFAWQKDDSAAPPTSNPSSGLPAAPPPRFPDCGPCGKW
eukprot:6061404-Pleurochrysis_carterae.AAC.1